VKKIIIAVFVIFSIVENVSSDEIQISQELLKTEALENFDWYGELSIESVTLNWMKCDNAGGWEDKREVKTAKVKILTQIFDGSLRKYTDGAFEIAYVKDDFTFNLMNKMMSFARKTWGEPYSIVDLTEPEQFGVKSVYYRAQWLFNETLIHFHVLGHDSKYEKEEELLGALLFSHKEKHELLKNLICLKCDSKRIFTKGYGEDEVADEDDIIFIIDLNDNNILRRDKSTLGKITTITDGFIEAKWEDKKAQTKSTLRIDRVLGSYNLEIVSTNVSGVKLRQRGNCSKIEMNELEPLF
jgi:hypothetical protein